MVYYSVYSVVYETMIDLTRQRMSLDARGERERESPIDCVVLVGIKMRRTSPLS
jgi:hypothetical protein